MAVHQRVYSWCVPRPVGDLRALSSEKAEASRVHGPRAARHLSGRGHVAITSRHSRWAEVVVPDEVDLLARAESVAMLRAGRVAAPGGDKGFCRTAAHASLHRNWWARLISSDLKAHQLPDPVGQYRRPVGW